LIREVRDEMFIVRELLNSCETNPKQSTEAWEKVGNLGERFRAMYNEIADGDAPSEIAEEAEKGEE